MDEPEQREKTTKLLEYFNERIKIEPFDVALHVYRSACYEELGNYKEALDDAMMIIDLDPSYWKGYHQALNIQIKLGIAGEDEIPECFAKMESFKDLIEKRDQMKAITPDCTSSQNFSFENEASAEQVIEKTSSNSGSYGGRQDIYNTHQNTARSSNIQSTSQPHSTSRSNKNKKKSPTNNAEIKEYIKQRKKKWHDCSIS